jgi:hypothetical protein
VWWKAGEDEYAAVGISLVERDAIDMLGLPYLGEHDGQYRFEVTVTHVSYKADLFLLPASLTHLT